MTRPDLSAVARNIVNQILDESGADVATRQRINDACDAFTLRMLDEALASEKAAREDDEQDRRKVTDVTLCVACSREGHTCYPSAGVARCPVEACASCDYAVPDRTGWKARADKAEQERDEARRDRDHYGAKLDDLLNGNTYTGWVDRSRKAEARVAELEAGITRLAAEARVVAFDQSELCAKCRNRTCLGGCF